MRSTLNAWRGLGDIIVGMHAQGFDVELRQLGDNWQANFYATGMAHSVVYGSGWEASAWRAVSRAPWQAISDPRINGLGHRHLRFGRAKGNR